MKKIILITLLSFFIISNILPSLVMAQSPATTTQTNSSSSIIQIKSASDFIHKAENLFKEAWQKVASAKRGEVIAKIENWLSARKQAIQNGWQEEKKEFHGNIKDIIANAWQKAIAKIKSWVIHK
ncbi:MAG: hypothetical protein NTZ42_01440 [Candidatus Gribaldobacteria bacterium]|nr:hypothetical protein [Candidatus Gribaldobacteria bacterium]